MRERERENICKCHLFFLRVLLFLLFYRIALRIKPVMINNNNTDINVAVVIKQHFFYEKTNVSLPSQQAKRERKV